MTVSRAAAWIFAGVVATAWFASAAGVSRTPQYTPKPQRPSPETIALDNLVADVQTQASRLRERLDAAPSPKAPFRNPFSFAERPAPVTRTTRPPVSPVVPESVPVAPPEPPLELIGIAEKKVGDAMVRTAMLSPGDADALIMAAVGQKILGAYEVIAVGTDAVELKDLVTGASRTLILK